jgi:PAS domain S-box-containing protein
MKIFQTILRQVNRLLDVPTSDPDDSRRRKLLNVMLAGLFLVAVLAAVITAVVEIFWAEQLGMKRGENFVLYWALLGLIVGCGIFYFINRKVSGGVAGFVFLLFLLVLISFSDTYPELVDGRSLFVFTIPIVMASMLVGPAFSFVFAILSSVELIILGELGNVGPNIVAMFGYFMLALVSWLSSRSLEQALRELRTVNADLDRRVEDRTRELSESLSRELVEAGRNQAILEGIADGVIVLDANGKSIVANPSLSRLLDMSPDSLMNQPIEEILQLDRVNSFDRQTTLAMLREPHKDMPSIRFRWGERTLLVNAAPVSTGLGDVIGTVAVFRDFTREAEVEQMKNTFVAMVSHELRTPLNAILGYAEMLREAVYGILNVRQTGVVERIESSSKRLLNMVSDLLDQAQLEAGRMRIFETEFKTNDLVDVLHAMMDKEVKDKGLILEVELDPQMPESLRGDPHRLQQILLNLVGNAVKFTDQGEVKVRFFSADSVSWGMEVTDTGPGIPAEAQPYVFDSFRQVDNVTTRQHGGIGLGLSIVRNLVQVFGGKITLTSKVGEGTTFTVILPLLHSKEEK